MPSRSRSGVRKSGTTPRAIIAWQICHASRWCSVRCEPRREATRGDATLKPSGAVIVSTPQDLSLIDARRAVAMFGQVQVPVLGIVENMSWFACPHCGERSDIFGHGGSRAEAERLGLPLLGEIPLDMEIRAASDAGAPPAAGTGPHAAAFGDLAARIEAALEIGADHAA